MTKEKNNGRKDHSDIVEDVRYYGTIPDEILGEMTPEIIEQYYLWDEVLKKEVERYPWLILPLIQEVFHKEYPENAEIRLIATEYVVRRIHKDGSSTLNSIFADIAVQIGDRDIYHVECQMNKDEGMVLRMLEYDIHIGLVYGKGNIKKASEYIDSLSPDPVSEVSQQEKEWRKTTDCRNSQKRFDRFYTGMYHDNRP